MIIQKNSIKIPTGLTYITQWQDSNGNYEISKYFANGRVIANKRTTGCGFTSWCLWNEYNSILVSPRVRLIHNKMEQADPPGSYYYFDREKDNQKQKSIEQLENEFVAYLQQQEYSGRQLKILVTYDSFRTLADFLEQRFQMDMSLFRIVIDESHSLVKDVKLKENSVQPVLPLFLERLFQYPHLLFISATPIVDYIKGIPEFIENEVWYYELEWSNIEEITSRKYCIRSSLQAFNQIYDHWLKHTDPNGIHVFDEYYQGNTASFSYEAVIFLNSVKDICTILAKYIKKDRLINPADVTIVCRECAENTAKVQKVDHGLSVATSIPKRGQYHTTWTFVTRTAFEGVDFYNPTASTYVITNYNVSSLCIDIASDIPQIIGRQRVLDNPFRCVVNIFFTTNSNYDDAAYAAMQAAKEKDTLNQITLWSGAGSVQETALSNLQDLIALDPNRNYVRVVDGKPQYTELLRIAEDYSRDILVNHSVWYVIRSAQSTHYSQAVKQLLMQLQQPKNTMATKISLVYQCMATSQNPEEVFEMLFREEYSRIAYYFHELPLERIVASGFNTTKMDQEIFQIQQMNAVIRKIRETLIPGQAYSSHDVKSILQSIYDALGIKAKATATSLTNLCPDCQKKMVNGTAYYTIL